MPNWVVNNLNVTGKIGELKQFKKEHPRFLFTDVIPYPKVECKDGRIVDLEYSTSATNKNDGYHWCIDNWGTKWEIGDNGLGEDVQVFPRKLCIDFDTAWSPPEPIIHKLSELYSGLTFSLRYWEGGGCFKGHLKIKGGIELVNKQEDYHGHKGG